MCFMPDKRKHRGRHPDDERLFAEDRLPILRRAVRDYSWLLSREYSDRAALTLVGDRFQLTARQRMAVMRTACSDCALAARKAKEISAKDVVGGPIGVDGYNLLITVESALADGLVLGARDGCYRDLASIHGTYRKVEETLPALRLIAAQLNDLRPTRVDWYLDTPVSNSGRSKALLADVVESLSTPNGSSPTWNIELQNNPDALLRGYDGVTATSDSAVLDACGRWLNLARHIVDQICPDVWKIEFFV
jgi:hypothetical protein